MLGLASPTLAQKPDPTADILAKLRQPWDAPARETRLQDMIDVLSEKYGVAVIVNADEFKMAGVDGVLERSVRLPAAKGLGVRTVLRTALKQFNGAYLVRKDHIEIVPNEVALKETKQAEPGEPLVSVIVKEKPLNEVVADIAEEFDLNIVVAPQAGDSRMAFVSARLLNTPPEKAIDVLATTAELRVVRKGAVYFITSRDHANEMFGEKMERERQKIELEKLREMPANPSLPQTPLPVPKPEDKK
jgi:hypothetical protein